jgi:SAM-dependent methyltransferase
MRELVADFAVETATTLLFTSPVVEIGARPAPGQEALFDLRSQFPGLEFIGTDMQEGPRVDRVEDVHRLTFEGDSVGGVYALDTLEHVADPLRAMQEIWRVLKPGGIAVITSVMFFPIHEHPSDYWRFTPEGFAQLLAPFETSLAFSHGWEPLPDTVFGIGIKGPGHLERAQFPKTDARCRDWGKATPVDFGPLRMTTRDLWRRTLTETAAAVGRRLKRA